LASRLDGTKIGHDAPVRRAIEATSRMNSAERRAATARAAEAILDGLDPRQPLAAIEPKALREQAYAIATSCTAVAVFHAEKIAALASVQARRAAVEGLPAKLQPAVKRRLAALWKAREQPRA